MKKEELKQDTITNEEEKKKDSKIEDKVELTKEEVEAINNKATDAEEKFLRAQADLINYRKRKDDEVNRMLKYANENLIVELLPIIDNFERAIKMDENDKATGESNILKGVKMVYNSLIDILKKYGVKEIESLNKPFDASVHQAVMTELDETKEKEIILEVYQKGYILKDKVIRPAMVKVNK